MTISEKLLLGVNTTVIGMGIVFIVLIFLCLIVMFESYLFRNVNMKKTERPTPQDRAADSVQESAIGHNFKKGVTSGQATIEGIDSDEELAAIMASVSSDADIPLSQLKIKKVKQLKK